VVSQKVTRSPTRKRKNRAQGRRCDASFSLFIYSFYIRLVSSISTSLCKTSSIRGLHDLYKTSSDVIHTYVTPDPVSCRPEEYKATGFYMRPLTRMPQGRVMLHSSNIYVYPYMYIYIWYIRVLYIYSNTYIYIYIYIYVYDLYVCMCIYIPIYTYISMMISYMYIILFKYTYMHVYERHHHRHPRNYRAQLYVTVLYPARLCLDTRRSCERMRVYVHGASTDAPSCVCVCVCVSAHVCVCVCVCATLSMWCLCVF
jgi:hypothetical protein